MMNTNTAELESPDTEIFDGHNWSAEDAYFHDIPRNRLTPDEEKELATKGDDASIDKLITSNLLLVAKCAQKYRRTGIDIMDAISEGNKGLMRAVERFDPTKNVKFSTYAVYWINFKMDRFYENQSRTVRVPVHQWKKSNVIKKAQDLLFDDLGRDPTIEEVSAFTGIPTDRITDTNLMFESDVSLDQMIDPYDEGDAISLSAFIADDGVDPNDMINSRETSEAIAEAFAELREDERNVIMAHFGMIDGVSRNLNEIARDMGMSRPGVSYIFQRGVKKLRKSLSVALDRPLVC